MPEATARMTVRQVTASTSIIDVEGDVSALAEPVLMQAYTRATTPSTHTFILNFSGLEYMNSSGIGLLVTLLIRINRQQQHLLAYGLNEHYQRIFALTRLNEAIGLYPDESAALAAAAHLA